LKKYFSVVVLLPILALIFFNNYLYSPKQISTPLQTTPTKHELSLLFLGDIMGHQPQINAAYNPKTKVYEYDSMFTKVKPIFDSYDVTIGNLEVTLAGAPYSGYPSFSSPKSLAKASKDAGIDILVTANNHACDKGSVGIRNTIKALDELNMTHTGTFTKVKDRADKNLIVIDKNGIKVGLLNYTEHTNWVPTPNGMMVNRINLPQMIKDINAAKSKNLDKLIVMLHWGCEYMHQADTKNVILTKALFKAGVDIVMGGHPHVLQPMHHYKENNSSKEHLVYYSLGNFVSDQRIRYTNGGAMAGFTLRKIAGKTEIIDPGYHLIWVNKHKKEKRNIYEVLPIKTYESNKSLVSKYSKVKIEQFISDSRALLDSNNSSVREFK
jgi:poly-gamma-glutamate capsule biosynthesis protein CapA/YwtB (metallophosphatase superfamily)